MAQPRAYSLVGMLVTMACIVVLMVIGLNAMNKAVTGAGATTENSLHSMQDKFVLYGLHQALVVAAQDFDNKFLVPSAISHTEDMSLDTTANFFSALVGQRYANTEHLISANERSATVWEMEHYDFAALSARDGIMWDPQFKADLDELSNTSFAHMPMYGERFERYWQPHASSVIPLLGNRGPRDGKPDPSSYTYGRDGTWAGHFVFGDGHVDYVQSFELTNVVYELDGVSRRDNAFAMESGPEGADAIISFTKSMSAAGPVLQYD